MLNCKHDTLQRYNDPNTDIILPLFLSQKQVMMNLDKKNKTIKQMRSLKTNNDNTLYWLDLLHNRDSRHTAHNDIKHTLPRTIDSNICYYRKAYNCIIVTMTNDHMLISYTQIHMIYV